MLNTGILNLEHFSNSQGNSGSDTLPLNSTFIDDVNDNADNSNNAFINLPHVHCCSPYHHTSKGEEYDVRCEREYREHGECIDNSMYIIQLLLLYI